MSDEQIALFVVAGIIYAQRKSVDYTPEYAIREARALLALVLAVQSTTTGASK